MASDRGLHRLSFIDRLFKNLPIAYHVNPKYSDGQTGAERVDPDQTPQNAASYQGLHRLPFIIDLKPADGIPCLL